MILKFYLKYFFVLITFSSFGQGNSSSVQTEKLSFAICAKEAQFFEIIESKIDINDGKIEEVKQTRDTCSIKSLGTEGKFEVYELKLSKQQWIKLLYDSDCPNLTDEITQYPDLIVKHRVEDNQIIFKNKAIIGDFLNNNFLKRIECISNINENKIPKYLTNWVRQISNDSIDVFVPYYISHFDNIFSLFNLKVPKAIGDTCYNNELIKSKGFEFEFNYKCSKILNEDATISYHFSDDVDGKQSLEEKFFSQLYNTLKDHEDASKRNINEIRMKSMRSVDKSTLVVNKDNIFESFIRIGESSMLNSSLRLNQDFYNYEIIKLDLNKK